MSTTTDEVPYEWTEITRLEAENRELRAKIEQLEAELAHVTRKNVSLASVAQGLKQELESALQDHGKLFAEKLQLKDDVMVLKRAMVLLKEEDQG